MSIKTVVYTMPECVAGYAMHGDPSGYDDLDTAYDAWAQRELDFHKWKGFHLVDVEENGFMKYHELHDFGIGSCDTSEFVFHVIE